MQTTAPTSSYGVRLERYSRQRDEWIKVLQMRITPSVEQLMRKMYKAAEICATYQPEKHTVESAYSKLVAITKAWTDEEIKEELGEKRAEDADVCLQMAVKSHATVLALATARSCKQVITVPSILRFFRSVLEACVAELSDPELFCKSDIELRVKVRRWIDQVVMSQAINIVPVGMFAKCSSATQDYYNQVSSSSSSSFVSTSSSLQPSTVSAVATKGNDVVTYGSDVAPKNVSSNPFASTPQPPPSPTLVAQKKVIEDAEMHVNEEIRTDDEEEDEEDKVLNEEEEKKDEPTVKEAKVETVPLLLPKKTGNDDKEATRPSLPPPPQPDVTASPPLSKQEVDTSSQQKTDSPSHTSPSPVPSSSEDDEEI